MTEELIYEVALSMLPRIGPVRAKALLAYCGSASAIFREKKKDLLKIPDIGPVIAGSIRFQQVLAQAEKELKYIEKNNIRALFFTDKSYPDRLKQCEDGPIMVFLDGQVDLNPKYVVSIVGTRRATPYGKQLCAELIEGLIDYKPLVVSGLAYGIDIEAHRVSLESGLPTIACLAHGLDRIYPSAHSGLAKRMKDKGGLLTEFLPDTKPDRELFPMRNRIIAGMSDCTIVVESDTRGGSILTAHLASSYNRDVFAFPGRIHDKFSSGCNHLIKTNVASILNSPQELIRSMGWDEQKLKPRQLSLAIDLSEDELLILEKLRSKERIAVDDLAQDTHISVSSLSSILIQMEFKNLIKSLPGKVYQAGI
ncbi:MAG: DNA-processing protein DprA [Flavobacteriales bacterium]|nr:DNA-processing protein DprA [Flavobacteriales bacterium]